MEIGGIGVVLAFAAGLVSFVSPCVLPLVPGYVSFVAGRSLDDLVRRDASLGRASVLPLGLCFVLGFSAVFIALGAGASAVGQLFRTYLYEGSYIAGALIVVFGIHMMGLLRWEWLNREWRLRPPMPGGRPLGALLLGMAFAFGWTPCIGPVLGAILTLGAGTAGVEQGMALLAIYSLGLAVPFLLVTAFMEHFVAALGRLTRAGRTLQVVAGGMLALVGVGMITGYLNSMGTWLLATFPVFQMILL